MITIIAKVLKANTPPTVVESSDASQANQFVLSGTLSLGHPMGYADPSQVTVIKGGVQFNVKPEHRAPALKAIRAAFAQVPADLDSWTVAVVVRGAFTELRAFRPSPGAVAAANARVATGATL